MRLLLVVSCLFLYISCNEQKRKDTPKEIDNSTSNLKTTLPDSTRKPMVQPVEKDTVEKIVELDYSIKLSELKNQQDSILFLKKYYDQFEKNNDSISEVKFFSGFPSTFKEFNALYGYDDEKGEMPLYFDGDKHLEKYSEIRKYVSDSVYYDKLINIACQGEWEADNVNFLQDILIEKMKDNPQTIIDLLQSKSQTEVLSFWKFYFDGPHPVHEVPSFLKEAITPDMYRIVSEALQNVQQKWRNH
ncbi:hypothetical protein [Flagellimonas marina]|uniref:Uncharacterized protein n=1 Tax=Flagellimonas marina TaxID=1775168 RepID=A0ABV8PR72_9FLAO